MIDMFLKIPEIPGDSVNAAHPNEIPVLAYSLGFTTSSAGTRTSRPVAQNLSVTIYYSKVSPPLFLALCKGTVFPTVTLTDRLAGGTPRDYLTITLERVTVTSDSQGGSGGEDRLTQNLTFAFNRISYSYIGVDDAAQTLPAVKAGFDFNTNQPIP